MGEPIDLGEYAGFTADPYPVYEELRARGPVHRVRLPKPADDGEAWLIVGHEEARAALTDPRLVKSPAKLGFSGLDEELIGAHLLITDPPHHTRLRSSSPALSPRAASNPCARASSASPTTFSTRCSRTAAPTSSSRSPSHCRSRSSASCSACPTSTAPTSGACRTRWWRRPTATPSTRCSRNSPRTCAT